MKVTFSRQELLAALLFASTDETRFVITGLCVNYRPNRKPTMVATDGRRLCVIEAQFEQEQDDTPDGERSIILSGGFVKTVCALNKALDTSEGKLFPLITFSNDPGSSRVTVQTLTEQVFLDAHSGAIIEGVYPDWQKCVPSRRQPREPVAQLGMNAAYVGDFAKAAKLFNRDLPQIQMALVGKDQVIEIVIPGVPNFYGLFMPVKADDSTEFQPEFLGIVEGLPKPEPKPEPEPETVEA